MIRKKVFFASVAFAASVFAQSAEQQPAAAATPSAAAAAAPLPSPSITGPLQAQPPADLDIGGLGKVSVNGILSGAGLVQGNALPGFDTGTGVLTNGQIIVQKADGVLQFYVQAGGYALPSLGTPFLSTEDTISNTFGAVPVAYLKLAGKSTSVQIGSLPTLIGAEYTFTFQNMNVYRGLLWNQENAVTKGIQLNQTLGKFAASLSWTDGFYSNRYTWLTGSLAYTNGAHALAFVAGGNYGQTAFQTFATPLQNNSTIYNIIYTYNKNGLILQPYFQYTRVPTNAKIGVTNDASTTSGAVLVSKTLSHGFSLAGRWEYIASSGSQADGSPNLLYGPGSSATSLTVTPTYQTGGLFVRGDVGFVHASSIAPGFAFGGSGTDQTQVVAAIELGFMFGDNLHGKH